MDVETCNLPNFGEIEDIPDKTFTHVPIDYVPKVKLVDHNLPTRRYVRGDKSYKSVTTILKPMESERLLGWKQDTICKFEGDIDKALAHCDNWSGESMSVGTAMHLICERYLNNQPMPVKGSRAEDIPDLRFDPFLLFKSMKHNLNRIDNVRGVEIPVHSDTLDAAGTIDCVADFDGRLAIIDHKNSRRRKTRSKIDKYVVQEAVYGYMWEELTGTRPELIVTNIASWDLKPSIYPLEYSEYRDSSIEKFKRFRDSPPTEDDVILEGED